MSYLSDLLKALNGSSSTVRRYRIEGWESGQWAHVLAMVEQDRVTPTCLVSLDRHTGDLRFGRFVLESDGRRTDLECSREALLKSLVLNPATPAQAELIGLPCGTTPTLPSHIHAEVMRAFGSDVRPGGRRKPDPEDDQFVDLFMATLDDDFEDFVTTLGGADWDSVRCIVVPPDEGLWGYARTKGNALEIIPEMTLSAAPSYGRRGNTPPEINKVAGNPDKPDAVALLARIEAEYARAFAPILAHYARDEAMAIVGPTHWSPRAAAFYSGPSQAKERRRQAARLYPALAPLMAHDDELARLIDAGRPYEARIRDILASWMPNAVKDGVTVGLVRRLKALPNDVVLQVVCEAVHIAAQVPLDWLPENQEDWCAFLVVASNTQSALHTHGLPLSDMLRHARGQWRACADQIGNVRMYQHNLAQARDLVRRLEDTLVRPLAGRMGLSRASRLRKVAAGLLFAGKTAPGILKASEHWHANLHTLEAALPRNDAACRWPALIAPYEAPNGLVIVPLTDQIELMEEGGKIPDRQGAMGLRHCVGGYGRQCFTGDSFILSVRRLLPDGRYERLSTLELTRTSLSKRRLMEDELDRLLDFHEEHGALPPDPDGLDPDDLDFEDFLDTMDRRLKDTPKDSPVRVVQHRALGNAEPPEEAHAAVRALLEGIASGQIPLNADALTERSPDPFDAPFDWDAPGTAERAIKAWAPYLPKEIVAGGVEALRRHIAEGFGVECPEPAAESPSP